MISTEEHRAGRGCVAEQGDCRVPACQPLGHDARIRGSASGAGRSCRSLPPRHRGSCCAVHAAYLAAESLPACAGACLRSGRRAGSARAVRAPARWPREAASNFGVAACGVPAGSGQAPVPLDRGADEHWAAFLSGIVANCDGHIDARRARRRGQGVPSFLRITVRESIPRRASRAQGTRMGHAFRLAASAIDAHPPFAAGGKSGLSQDRARAELPVQSTSTPGLSRVCALSSSQSQVKVVSISGAQMSDEPAQQSSIRNCGSAGHFGIAHGIDDRLPGPAGFRRGRHGSRWGRDWRTRMFGRSA